MPGVGVDAKCREVYRIDEMKTVIVAGVVNRDKDCTARHRRPPQQPPDPKARPLRSKKASISNAPDSMEGAGGSYPQPARHQVSGLGKMPVKGPLHAPEKGLPSRDNRKPPKPAPRSSRLLVMNPDCHPGAPEQKGAAVE